MSINASIRRRQLGLKGRMEIDFAIDQIRLKEVVKLPNSFTDDIDDLNIKTYGPLACTKVRDDVFAVANEDGYINIMRTKKLENIAYWLAHENAIFDIKACHDGKAVMTASGDATIRQWDIETKKEILKLATHYSSVKSLSIHNAHTVASGSRDGSIKIYDIRKKNPIVIVIKDAHRNLTFSKPRKLLTKTDPISCVTNVVFDPFFPRIYSTGANDATIKLWDLRNARVKRGLDGQNLLNQPYIEVHHPSKGVHCGYSHLLLSSGRIYAACSDNKIYCYENFGSNAMPIRFTGYRYDTYLKLAVMDDRFLFSGAKGGGAMMWNLGNKHSSKYYPETTKQPIGQLKPDSADRFDTNVIETDWSSLSIFSFRDDGLVCKWTMQHVSASERKRLLNENALVSVEDDVTIQMSDIIDVNVLRPNHRVSNSQLVPDGF